MKRFHIHDASFNVWLDDKADTQPTHAAIRKCMVKMGFTFHQRPETKKHYRSIAKNYHTGRRKDVHFASSMMGIHIEVQFYEDVIRDNPNGGKYHFDKLKKMPYLRRLRTILAMQKLGSRLMELGFQDASAIKPRDSIHMMEIRRAELVKFHGESFYTDPIPSYNSTDRDGNTLADGQVRYTRSPNGHLIRGTVHRNINNMWWLLVSRHELHNVGSHRLFTCDPATSPRKLSIEPKAGIGRALKRALAASNYLRAHQIQQAIDRLYGKHDLKPGHRVGVDHPNYHGEGVVDYVKPCVVGVKLQNGNTWEYETATVRPAAEQAAA